MKSITLFGILMIFISCSEISTKESENPKQTETMSKELFKETFQEIDPADYREWLSDLMREEDYTVLTAGNDSLYNSMAASWEALALYFNSPTIMNLIGAKRYTLEFIRKHKTYTLSFLPEQYKDEVFALGSKSGRNSNKMKETKLTHVTTPLGNIAYQEASVVVECQLFEITTVNPNDFYSEEGKKFVEKAYSEAQDYHKLVYGKITKMWVQRGSNRSLAKFNSSSDTTTNVTVPKTPIKQKRGNSNMPFPLITLSLATLLTYAFSTLMQYKRYISKATHRKIWNVILLASFLISGLLGFFIIIPVNYHFTFASFPLLRTLHVDLGIIMVIVSIFHCIWHLDYFKKIVSTTKKH